MNRSAVAATAAALLLCTVPLVAQVQEAGAGVRIDFVDVDVRSVVQSLSPYLDRPVIFGPAVAGRVTLQASQPVTRAELVALLRAALETNNLDLAEEGAAYVVRSRALTVSQQAVPPVSPAGIGRGGVELFVIRLRHARATDVAATVNALYGRASAVGELGAARPTLSSQLRDSRIAEIGGAAVAAPTGSTVAGSGGFAGEVAIVPDARTNALLIRASRSDYELVRAAVEQVDVRPLQVMIEVVIAEVRRNSEFSYALSASVGSQRIRDSENTTVQGRTLAPGTTRSDLEITGRGIGGVDLNLTLRAGVARGAVTVLSRPIVLAANNERAEIMVGDQRPFVQLQESTDGGSLRQVVQYRDVGTRLSVLPTVSNDGYVQLAIVQEVNSATNATGPGNAPVISTRSLETSLLVRDGQTAVLGGLSEAIRERGSSGISFLSDLPLIGGVFGGKTRVNADTELFLFLTPRVVRDDAGMDSTVESVRTRGGRGGKLGTRRPPITAPVADTDSVSPLAPGPPE